MDRQNTYQTKVWRDIQQLYGHPIEIVNLLGVEYQAKIKQKKVGPWSYCRIQILGVTRKDGQIDRLVEAITTNKKLQSYHPVFIQLGIVIIFAQQDEPLRTTDQEQQHILQQRNSIIQQLNMHRLYASFRENMPSTTIVMPTNITEDVLLKRMNTLTRRQIRKGQKHKVEFEILASPSSGEGKGGDQNTGLEQFYQTRKSVANKKGFHIVSKSQLDCLYEYLYKEENGWIAVTKHQGELVAGGVYVIYEGTVLYLYGFARREAHLKHAGGQQYLQRRVRQRAKQQGFTYVDLFGGSPTGSQDHYLTSVDKFKCGLGGIKLDMRGSVDLIQRPLWYWLSKIFYHIRSFIK